MGMVGHEGPGVTAGLCLRQKPFQPLGEIITIMFIPEDVTTLNSSDYDMMQDTCAIKSGVTGHKITPSLSLQPSTQAARQLFLVLDEIVLDLLPARVVKTYRVKRSLCFLKIEK
jgi:hypothetical protein